MRRQTIRGCLVTLALLAPAPLISAQDGRAGDVVAGEGEVERGEHGAGDQEGEAEGPGEEEEVAFEGLPPGPPAHGPYLGWSRMACISLAIFSAPSAGVALLSMISVTRWAITLSTSAVRRL